MAFVAVVSEKQGARRSVKFAPLLKNARESAYAGRLLQPPIGCYDNQINLRDKFGCIA